MSADKIVHFVYFETMLCTQDFLVRWERYHSSTHIDTEVTLQQSKKGDVFTYIAKHSCNLNEFQFEVIKGAKLTRAKQTEIKKIQLGGYSITEQENVAKAKKDEYTLYVFLDKQHTNISAYKVPSARLNIYRAYFENCTYAYILEYFVKHANVDEFKENLHQFNTITPTIYTIVK
jgi:hypothetical protein